MQTLARPECRGGGLSRETKKQRGKGRKVRVRVQAKDKGSNTESKKHNMI